MMRRTEVNVASSSVVWFSSDMTGLLDAAPRMDECVLVVRLLVGLLLLDAVPVGELVAAVLRKTAEALLVFFIKDVAADELTWVGAVTEPVSLS